MSERSKARYASPSENKHFSDVTCENSFFVALVTHGMANLASFPPSEVLPETFAQVTRLSKSCQVQVELNRPYYMPGERIEAKIILKVLKPVTLLRLRWHLFGGELVHWEDDQGTVKNIYHEANELLNEFYSLYDGSESQEPLSLIPGLVKEWRAHYALPLGLPPTFSSEASCILYYFRVLVKLEGFERIIQTVEPLIISRVPDPEVETLVSIRGQGTVPSPTIMRRFLWGHTSSQLSFTAELFPCIYLPPLEKSISPAMFSIAISLIIESAASFPLKEVSIIVTQLTKLRLRGHQYIEKDNIIQHTHKFATPIEPNCRQATFSTRIEC